MTWYQLVLLVLATYRITLLITQDQFPLGPIRGAIDRNWTGSLVDFIHCAWCVSMWVGAGFLLLTLNFWWPWQYFELVFVASGVTGYLAERS